MNKNYPGTVLVSFGKEHQQSFLAKTSNKIPAITALHTAAAPVLYRLIIRVLQFVDISAQKHGILRNHQLCCYQTTRQRVG